MSVRMIAGIVIIIVGIGLVAVNFFSSTIEYGTFAQARATSKKMQVKGAWLSDRGIYSDEKSHSSSFFMIDDNNDTAEVVLNTFVPANFSLAKSIVVKGKFQGNIFYATEVLTKCPSKYEGTSVQSVQ